MAENDPHESTEVEHSYLDVGPTGPRKWFLALGAIVLVLAISAGFYGLYAINRGASPTLTPAPAALTQAALAQTRVFDEATPTTTSISPATLPTPSATPAITSTAEAPTYTVQQGDTLIGIAQRLNVSVDGLTAFNQIDDETIFPDQVLSVPPTVTALPVGGPFFHTVSQGETLISIAALHKVTVENIKSLNALTSDTILVGQQIQIPAGGVRPPTPTPTPEPWSPAIITDDLASAYSLTKVKSGFTLHISPDTRAATAGEMQRVVELVETALDHSQDVIQRRFAGRLDVYVSNTFFEAPYTNRRGFNLPDQERLFLLYDGSGTTAERLYYTTYALTSLMAARTLGEAASPLLSEGLAVQAAGQALVSETMPRRDAAAPGTSRAYLSPEQLCAAYQHVGELPNITQPLQFEGHLGNLDQYLAAGCFVAYLIETEGLSAFSDVYLSGDYQSVYGKTLEQLAADWTAVLRDTEEDFTFDPDALVQIASDVNEAYRRLWAEFEGTPAQFSTYDHLDRARMALLQGRLDAAQGHLEQIKEPLE
jgi:LysM repeat protein